MAEASVWPQIESLAQLRFREFMQVARAIAAIRALPACSRCVATVDCTTHSL